MNRGSRLLLAVGLISALIFFSGLAWAGDGALDLSFNPGVGVQKIPIIRGQANWTTGGYANGNSLIFGYFTSITDGIGTHPVSSIAKLTRLQRHGGHQLQLPDQWRGARRVFGQPRAVRGASL